MEKIESSGVNIYETEYSHTIEKEEILGISICNTTYEELQKCLQEDIYNSRKTYIATINSVKVYQAGKDNELKRFLNEATYQIPDGIGIIYASKIKKGKIRNRITGIDTMQMMCKMANENNYRVFLYGAEQQVVEKTKENLEKQYNSLTICGYLNGFEKKEQEVIDTINTSNTDILFVALGSPKQEKFIARNIDKIDCKIILGVGGSFDIVSGLKKRAPRWMQKEGLEWLYRLIKEPKRIFKQIQIFAFMLGVIKEKKNK